MWNPVESSNIEALAYENKHLKIKFKNGSEYHYQNVSQEVFEKILHAASVGRTFHELIKSKPAEYPFTRAA